MSSQFFAFLVAKTLLDEQRRVEQERTKERCKTQPTNGSPEPCDCSDCDPGFRRAATVEAQKA